jgi:glycogen debranching enzyme
MRFGRELTGLGSVSEIFDGDAPFAQAWSVGELLRALTRVGREGSA